MGAAPIPAVLMGPSHATPAIANAQVGSHAIGATLAAAALPPTAPRAPMSRGKKIRLGILGAVILLIVTKQYWVFALIPVIAVLSMNRDMRKIAKLTIEMIMSVIDKTADPERPAPQPAPAIAAQAPVTPAKPAPKPLPPAIRAGFSFRDLLPKRREDAPQGDPYANLAASIRDERLRRGGA